MDDPEIEDKDLAPFFPNFVWVLRDFGLDLQGKSSKEYLEDALQPIQENFSESETTSKNLIRQKISSYFKLKDCQTLIRPLTNDDQLNQIESQPWDSLKSMFRYSHK